MVTVGRENKEDNDLFFVCGLIEYISRKTKNRRKDVVNQLGKDNIYKIYHLADIYHSDNIDRVSDEFIDKAHISTSNFDNISSCGFTIPSHFDIAKVYKRLIKMSSINDNKGIIDSLFDVYNSFISSKIDDYNSSVYYESPQYLFACYNANQML